MTSSRRREVLEVKPSWYVHADEGDDRDDGSLLFPLRSYRETARRLSGGLLTSVSPLGVVVIHLLSDLPEDDPIDQAGRSEIQLVPGTTLVIRGVDRAGHPHMRIVTATTMNFVHRSSSGGSVHAEHLDIRRDGNREPHDPNDLVRLPDVNVEPLSGDCSRLVAWSRDGASGELTMKREPLTLGELAKGVLDDEVSKNSRGE